MTRSLEANAARDKPGAEKVSGDPPGPWWLRLLWFVGLWAAGVAAVGAVGYAIRWWLA